jgi:hypothetical protein
LVTLLVISSIICRSSKYIYLMHGPDLKLVTTYDYMTNDLCNGRDSQQPSDSEAGGPDLCSAKFVKHCFCVGSPLTRHIIFC